MFHFRGKAVLANRGNRSRSLLASIPLVLEQDFECQVLFGGKPAHIFEPSVKAVCIPSALVATMFSRGRAHQWPFVRLRFMEHLGAPRLCSAFAFWSDSAGAPMKR